MNLAARRAAVSKLVNDAQLADLLAVDPQSPGEPVVVLEDGNTAPSAYPCITYKIVNAAPDPRFAPTPAEGGGESNKEDWQFEVRVYGKTTVEVRNTIANRVRALLTGVRIEFTGGAIHHTQLLTELPDQADYTRNARFILLRFHFWVTLS